MSFIMPKQISDQNYEISIEYLMSEHARIVMENEARASQGEDSFSLAQPSPLRFVPLATIHTVGER